MSFFPDVAPGEQFRPSAKKENALSRLLNTLNGFSGGVPANVKTSSRLKIYNSGAEELQAGTPVVFDSEKKIIGDSVPAKRYDGASTVWGVVTDTLSAGEFGSAVVSGPVQVQMKTEGSGKCAEPSADGKGFDFSGSGAVVLGTGKDGEKNIAIIALGFGSGVALCKITSVPEGGVGGGTAKMITGFSADGTPVLAENDSPIYVPRLQ